MDFFAFSRIYLAEGTVGRIEIGRENLVAVEIVSRFG